MATELQISGLPPAPSLATTMQLAVDDSLDVTYKITLAQLNTFLTTYFVPTSYATTVTAAGTTTLTATSAQQQYFTGSSTQTVALPVASTLFLGKSFYIVNNSSGNVTVQSSGGNTVQVLAANTNLLVTCILTSGTSALSWNAEYGTQTFGSLTLQNANSVAITGGSATLGTLTYFAKYNELPGSAVLAVTNSNQAFIYTAASVDLSDGLGLSHYTNGFTFYLKNVSAGNCTFTPFTGEFIDGLSVLTLAPQDGYFVTKTATQWSIISEKIAISGVYLPLSGGTMSGVIAMGAHKITGVADPSAAQDAMTLNYAGLTYLALAGGTMTGNLILNADPTTALGAVTKQYADNIASGLNPITGVIAASTGALTVTYSNGVAGVGATLTNAGAQATFSLDSISATVGQRVLIKNQASAFQNGVYTVTNVGSGASNWILTRATDYDMPSQIQAGDLLSVETGTINAGSSWYQSATVSVIGTDSISFSVFFSPTNYAKSGANADITSMSGLTGFLQAPVGIKDNTGNVIIAFSGAGVTSNFWLVGSSASGSQPVLTMAGVDSNISGIFRSVGTGAFLFVAGAGTQADLVAFYPQNLAGYSNTFNFGTPSANRTTTFPDADGTVALLDAHSNLTANNFLSGYTTTATAAATTTLTVASTYQQFFTGTTTQTVLLPVTSTLGLGFPFYIVNNSTGVVTVQSSGGNTIQAMAARTTLLVSCILTSGTTAASWSAQYVGASGGGGSSPFTVVYKSNGTQTLVANTKTVITGMDFTPVANKAYRVQANIAINNTSSGDQWLFGLTDGSISTSNITLIGGGTVYMWGTDNTANFFDNFINQSYGIENSVGQTLFPSATGEFAVIIDLVFTTNSTTSAIQFYAAATSGGGGSDQILNGSTATYTQLN